MTVRAFFRAAIVPDTPAPYHTLHLKIFYPAQLSQRPEEQNFGIVPVDPSQAPFPVVIFFNGINCGADLYQWLAVDLAARGLVVVTFNWIAENIPGFVAITPGVDIAMMAPDRYGTGPTATALPTLLNELKHLHAEGPLAGQLDLDCIILGGHSAGGRVALENANPQFFPGIAAAFAYGAHSAATVQLGYGAGEILPLPDSLPLLLLGGTEDGVIIHSSHRYGITWPSAETPIIRTFQEAIAGGRNDCYLGILAGANHFSIASTIDGTTGRPFLDAPATQPLDNLHSCLAHTIGNFIDAHGRGQAAAIATLAADGSPPHAAISHWDQK
jgi:dienelactone hydrolase